MLRRFIGLLGVILAATSAVFAQTSSRIDGVSEPPELTGEPKKVSQPTEAERKLFEIVGRLKNEDEARSTLPMLNKLIEQYPDYSDAYFLRATINACMLEGHDFISVAADVASARKHTGASIYNETDYSSLLGKIAVDRAEYETAVQHLQRAMTRDIDDADKMFNIEGVEPEKTSKACTWNLTELDTLISKFPSDYRPWLFRGLYYEFFTTFKEDYYEKAAQNFRKAALLNPRSPLPDYFIGRLYDKASFWTKKAWASDAGRDEPIRNAVQAYTRAIKLDPKFLLAYEQRASGYLNLKQYSQAIKDFDTVLNLNPEYASAYSDRGIAKLESGQYFAATVDFGDAIRRKKEGDSFVSNLYEYRADANVKLGQYRDAIADYSNAVERQLANDTFLLSLKQLRALYPEYDRVPDGTLLRKINALFWPQFEYKVFTEQIDKNGNWQIGLLNGLYEKRGDAYLRAGDFRRAVLDFTRIYKGIPNFADSTERWRMIGKGAGGEAYYLDVKSADFSENDSGRIWIKTTGKRETQTVAYEIDCKKRRLSSGSEVTYDPDGKVLRTSDLSSGWQQIVPDTIGEQLYSGTCSSAF
jgi:tetratricopeptide (TPR) repeat protein